MGENLGPKLNATPANGYFFVIFVLIGSFLFLNLFVGVIFKEFEDAQKEERASLMLKEHHVKWVDMMKMIIKATPDLETTNKPKSKWRLKIYSFITGEGLKYNYFEIFILVIIFLNMIHMALDYDDAPAIYTSTLNNINYFFTGIFFLECILKIIAYDMAYFTTSINKFDFFVVCTSLFEILLTLLSIWS